MKFSHCYLLKVFFDKNVNLLNALKTLRCLSRKIIYIGRLLRIKIRILVIPNLIIVLVFVTRTDLIRQNVLPENSGKRKKDETNDDIQFATTL